MRRNQKRIILIAIIIIEIIASIAIIKYLKQHTQVFAVAKDVTEIIEKEIEETDEVLINPGKGYTLQNSHSNSYDNLIAVGYNRYDWCDVEPEEGKYDWSKIDEDIKYYENKGKKYAFGIMCANTSSDKSFVTPEWVFNNGAKGRTIEATFWYDNSTRTQTIPVWTDKVFLDKLNNFISELAKKYDGNTNIAYIDIRSYGNWGEQHTGEIGGKRITAEELKNLYITPYMNNFKKTLLVNPWGDKEYNDTYKWAIENGVSIRRDGIFEYSNGSECSMAYGKLPSIFEYTGDYEWMKSSGVWSKEKLLEYIENGKPSYLQFDSKMYKENKEFCEMLANKIGYYFKLKKVKYTNSVNKGEETTINLDFINEGVAPLYENCYVYIGLLDNEGNLVQKFKTDIKPKEWKPNKKITEEVKIKFEDINVGKFKLAVGLYLNAEDESPTYLLGNKVKTKDNWYEIGEVNILTQNESKIKIKEKIYHMS